jgi:hypothetical protein
MSRLIHALAGETFGARYRGPPRRKPRWCRRTVGSVNDRAKDEERILSVHLDVHLDHTPISGCLRTAQGGEMRFVGWLGFVDALQRVQEGGTETRRPEESHDEWNEPR